MSETESTPAANAAPLVFNPLDPAFLRDPYPTYQRFQAQAPVFRTPLGIWLVTRYEDVQQVLRGPGFEHRFQDMARRRAGDRVNSSAAFLSLARWILMMNPPDHTRVRGLMSKAFSVRRVEGLKPRIQALVDRLIDRMIDQGGAGQADLMTALARPLPVIVICELLGVPEEDWPRFLDESCLPRHMLEPRPLSAREIDELDVAITSLGDYLGSLCEARRAAPRDDLISDLVQAEEQGDRLSSEELIANLILLFFAGHETTVNLIGNGLLALHQHPAELAKLRADRALVPNAVEEMLRYDNPTQIAGVRCTTEPITMGGVELPVGSQLVPVIGAANRDPQAFAAPNTFDITRTFTNKPLSFGGGIHFCLGAQLARSEAAIVLDTLLRRLPTLALEGLDAPQWHPSFTLRGLRTLPARWS
jgi:cytochrome P450